MADVYSSLGHTPALAGRTGAGRLRPERPEKWRVRLSRLHAALYRLHLGWLVGGAFMLITHRGRKTGKLRQTLTLIVHHDTDAQEAIVAAWGRGADWYRNIQSSPAIEVQIGSKRYRPEQRFVSAGELAEVLAGHRRQHPIRSRIQRFLLGWPGGSSEEELLALARSLGGVAFRLKNASERTQGV